MKNMYIIQKPDNICFYFCLIITIAINLFYLHYSRENFKISSKENLELIKKIFAKQIRES